MGGKPRQKRMPYADLKKLAEELAGDVIFALKYLNCPGSGVMVSSSGEVRKPWEEVFMDHLDKTGYVIDREAYYDMMRKS